MENGVDQKEFEKYTPKNPLPHEIQKMKRDETVCKYCGVSYLIHNEIKALEEKLKKTEAELETLRGCEAREEELKERIEKMKEENTDIKRNLEAKEILITTLKNNLKGEEEVRNENRQLKVKIETAMKLKEEYRQKHSLYDRNLPAVRRKLKEHRDEIKDIHKFIEQRDQQMNKEMEVLLSTVVDRCSSQINGKKELLDRIESLESEKSETSVMMVALREKLKSTEGEVTKLQGVVSDSTQLQQKVTQLESALYAQQTELDENLSKSRSLQMEAQQFKEQLRNKAKEVEELTSQFRQRDQDSEMNNKKLQTHLRQKEAELQLRIKELKTLEKKLHEEQAKGEEFHQKATRTVTASREIKQDLEKAKEEIDQLKSEREVMITSHQNRIEQLRNSFRQKIAESEGWPEKLQMAIQKEKENHAKALRQMEEHLKEDFVLEMKIEKQKYQELLEKYQGCNKDHETVLRQQLNSLENKYRSEIKELQQILTDSKLRAKDTEESLRKEVGSLKLIIKDLEDRLARLDSGNEEMIQKLKKQLQETHEDLEQSKQQLWDKEEQVQAVKQEVVFLQDTVRKECEERFELTEKLSEAREELLRLKKPSGGYNSQSSSRQSTLKSSNSVSSDTTTPGTTVSPPQSRETEPKSFQETDSRLFPPSPKGPVREYTVSSSSTVSYQGEQAKAGGKFKGNTLETTRKRIAAMLGRKS